MSKENEEAVEMPDSIQSVAEIAKEYLGKLQAIDDEIETLKEDKSSLREEYKRKLDLKTLDKALRIVKLRADVQHKDAFDTFMEILQDASW